MAYFLLPNHCGKLASALIVLPLVSASLFLASCSTKSKTQTSTATSYSGHGAESVPATTVRQFVAPPLTPSMAETIQSMLDVRATGAGVLSPDGKNLFYGWRVTGVQQVWQAQGPLSFPIQMTGGQNTTNLYDLTPDGKFLILSRDRNGEENPGLYLQPVAGGPLIEIQRKSKVQTFYTVTTKDSKFVYFSSNDIKPDSYAIYKYDIAGRKIEKVFDQDGIWSVADINNDGQLLLKKDKGSLWSEYHLYDEKTKKLNALVGQNEQVDYSMSFAKQPGSYYVRTNKQGDFHRLYFLKGDRWTPISADVKMNLDGFVLDQAKEKIYLSWNDQGYTRLEVLSTATHKPITLNISKNVDHVLVSKITPSGRYFSFAVDNGKQPRQTYVYDWKSGRSTLWLTGNAPEINTTQFSRATLEFYDARDGTKIPMWVRRPSQCASPASRCPVIVHFHGGPEAQTKPGFSTWAQIFVNAGFIFVEPNVRGSSGYGKAWLASDDGPNRLKVITDIEDAALFIKKTWASAGVSPKIGVMGGSYGGYSTQVAMTKFAGAFDAGVASVGMSNLATFLNNTAPYRRILRISEYGDPIKDRDALLELSPVTYIDRVKSPMLLIQGINDPRVPVGEALQMYEKMKARGLSSQLILFADEGHGASKRENQVLEIGHTLAFFEQHLK